MAGITFDSSQATQRWRKLDDSRPFHPAYEFAVIAGGALIWGVGGLAFSLAALLRFLLPQGIRLRVGRNLLRGTFRLFLAFLHASGLVRMRFEDLERLAKRAAEPNADPMIIAPNHPCLLDAVFIMAYVPNVTCIMKASLLSNPILRGGARLAGFIRNDTPRSLIDQATVALHDGSHLLIFPEGTRTRPDAEGVNPFKAGVALIASITNLPVQPVYLTANSRYLSKGWPIHRRPRFPLVYSARLGEPVVLRQGEKARQFLHRLEDHFRCELCSPGP